MRLPAWGSALGLCLALAACRSKPGPSGAPEGAFADGLSVARADFHGWDALVLRGRAAEAVVVPAIGRIMQLGLRADGATAHPAAVTGLFWAHPGLGPGLPADGNGWINFGGDKAWPAPQSDWPAVTGKGWPPPRTFDAVAYQATTPGGRAIELASPIDPAYGIRVRRTIALDPTRPVMTVETRYEKLQGPKLRVAVWTITELASPERVFARLPQPSIFPEGYRSRLPAAPKELRVDGRILSMGRDRATKAMIVTDAESLLWVGAGPDLLLERQAGSGDAGDRWPEGVRAQIYASPDDAGDYVELELIGPLRELAPGQTASLTVRYTLLPRSDPDPLREAQRVWSP